MADKDELKDDEAELVIIEADEIPAKLEEDSQPAGDAEDKLPADTDPDDDGEEEARLGDNEDDAQRDGETDAAYKTRRNRRERDRRKHNRERGRLELEMLRRQNSELEKRLLVLEGSNLTNAGSQIEAQIEQVRREIQQAEFVFAKAIEAGNGEDVTVAMRLRDEARDRLNQLNGEKQNVEHARTQQSQPRLDPMVVDYAKQWMQANPWFDPNAADEDSRITKAIDDGLVKEGFNPASMDYWQELTSRVNKRLGGDPAPAEKPTRRTPPPQGRTREHAPSSTRNEVYVTPERKQAMMDAGIWEDTARRNAMLKRYQEYDRENSAR